MSLIWIPLSRPGWLAGFPGRCWSLPLTSPAKTETEPSIPRCLFVTSLGESGG